MILEFSLWYKFCFLPDFFAGSNDDYFLLYKSKSRRVLSFSTTVFYFLKK